MFVFFEKKQCLCVVSRGGTVHVFVPNCHGTGISVRCMRPYEEYRQFTPNPEGGAAVMQRCLRTASASRRTANAHELRTWKQCTDSERVSHMTNEYSLKALRTQLFEEMKLCARVSYLSHSAQIQIFHNISIFAMYRIWMLNYYLLYVNIGFCTLVAFQRWHRGGRADVWLTVLYLIKYNSAVKLAMLELMCVCVCVVCVCVCVCVVCVCVPARSLSNVSLYQQNQL